MKDMGNRIEMHFKKGARHWLDYLNLHHIVDAKENRQ
jgi:hypothetical protein